MDGQTGQLRQLVSSKTAAFPVWSHNGEWLAFINLNDPGDNGYGSLWLTRRDSSQEYIVKLIPEISYNYQWSPTVNTLAVATREEGLWIITAGSDIPQQLVSEKGISSFAWSPDGKSIAYKRQFTSRHFC